MFEKYARASNQYARGWKDYTFNWVCISTPVKIQKISPRKIMLTTLIIILYACQIILIAQRTILHIDQTILLGSIIIFCMKQFRSSHRWIILLRQATPCTNNNHSATLYRQSLITNPFARQNNTRLIARKIINPAVSRRYQHRRIITNRWQSLWRLNTLG